MNVQDIIVDLSKKNVKPESIILRQGDKSGTTLRAKILDNGVEVSSLSGYTAKFVMRLPNDRFYYEVVGTISDKTAEFLIDETYAAVEVGVTNVAYVALTRGDVTKMSVNNVRVEVLPSVLDSVTPPPEWTAPIDAFIEESRDRVDAVVEDAEGATERANGAADTAEQQAARASSAADNAESKASDADEAAQRANEAAAYAEQFESGYNPLLKVGSSDMIEGNGEAVAASFLNHPSEAPRDGVARIESLHGRTIVWNQIIENGNFADTSGWKSQTAAGSISASDGILKLTIVNNVITSRPNVDQMATYTPIVGHVYLVSVDVRITSAKSSSVSFGALLGFYQGQVIPCDGQWHAYRVIHEATTNSYLNKTLYINSESSLFDNGDTFEYRNYKAFDLTAMFGAGNEPSTVEEFEALYPESYYPYDAGTLLSVNMEGVETVGFNQLDEEWQIGGLVWATGAETSYPTARRSGYISVFPNTAYYFYGASEAYGVCWYDADKTFISSTSNVLNSIRTSPMNARYMRVAAAAAIEQSDTCINFSWTGYRNGEYEPYWQQERAIPVAQYFPDWMRSAGTAYDELTATKAVKRVGEVDLGTLNWRYVSGTNSRFSVLLNDVKTPINGSILPNISCAELMPDTTNNIYAHVTDKTIGIHVTLHELWVYDSSYTDAAAFKAAMSGVMFQYELATPEETAISPELNLSYKVSDFGIECIIVPDGQMSAPPTLEIVYGYTAEGLRDDALAVIAPVENHKASANYAVGSYLVRNGSLYKVTSAIAAGESITVGTNVVQTTVMAELAAIS